MEIDTRFPTKLSAISDAPEPFRSALVEILPPKEPVCLLVHAPAFSSAAEKSPATLLAVTSNGWLVVAETENGGSTTEKSNFSDTLFLELTSALLLGQLKIYFAAVGTSYSATIKFDTVGEEFYREAIDLLLAGMWGGVVPDALSVLVRLLASLHDGDGNVAVQGLHEATTADVDRSPDWVRAESGMLDGVRQIGSGTVAQRLWAKPAITVIGIDTTPIAAASNTLIPRARAKVSLRVPPGGDSKAHLDALIRHLRQHTPWGAHITVTPGDVGQPYAIDATGPVYDAARAAFREAWGAEPVDMGQGGSIPFIAAFAEAFPEAKILVTGVEDPAAQAHSVNESLHLGVLERAATAEALLLDKLG